MNKITTRPIIAIAAMCAMAGVGSTYRLDPFGPGPRHMDKHAVQHPDIFEYRGGVKYPVPPPTIRTKRFKPVSKKRGRR